MEKPIHCEICVVLTTDETLHYYSKGRRETAIHMLLCSDCCELEFNRPDEDE